MESNEIINRYDNQPIQNNFNSLNNLGMHENRQTSDNIDEAQNDSSSIDLANITAHFNLINYFTARQQDPASLKNKFSEWNKVYSDSIVFKLDLYFKDAGLRAEINKAVVWENMVLLLNQILTQQLKVGPVCSGKLTSMLQQVQQNYLLLVNLVLDRLACDDPPEMLQQVVQLVKSKRGSVQKKREVHEHLKRNNSQLLILATEFCKQGTRSYLGEVKFMRENPVYLAPRPIFNSSLYLIANMKTTSPVEAREILLNSQTSTIEIIKNNKEMLQFVNLDYSKFEHPAEPYLPPIDSSQYEQTLVLDLDETLVHQYDKNKDSLFQVRPFMEEFLEEMAKHYELVVFTAATQEYADQCLNQIDPDRRLIKQRLYRQHATISNNVFVKDLKKIGRDMSRIMIVDNLAENFQVNPENGIFIVSWFNDPEDTILKELIPQLRSLVVNKIPDVRVELKKQRNQIIRNWIEGNDHLDIDKVAKLGV